VLRVVYMLDGPRTLAYLMAGSVWPFVFTMLFLILLTFVMSACIVEVVTNHIISHPEDETEMQKFYGSMSDAILFFFAAVTGGISWLEIVSPLKRVSPLIPILFSLYVGFAILVMLNLVTGVFVDSAHQMRESDEERQLTESLRRCSHEVGIEVDELISEKQFEDLLKNKSMCTYLDKHSLPRKTVYEYFCLISGKKGRLSVQDFLGRCFKLKGLGAAIELAKNQLDAANERMDLKKFEVQAIIDRQELKKLHRQGVRDRAELKALHKAGSRDRSELMRWHQQGAIERNVLKDMQQKSSLERLELSQKLDELLAHHEVAATPAVQISEGA